MGVLRSTLLMALGFACTLPAAQAQEAQPDAVVIAAAARRKKLARLQQLTPEQRRALLAKYERYKNLDAAKQAKLAASLRKMRELSPDQLTQLRANQQRFAKLDPTVRKQIEKRVGTFRQLAPDKQRAMLEQAQAWKRLTTTQQDAIRALPRDQQRTAFKNALAAHRRTKMLRKLTAAERAAIADVPDAALRRAIHGVMQTRREEQMRRLPEATRAQLVALPPGRERDRAFRKAIDGVNRFERDAYGLLTGGERRSLRNLGATERSVRMRELLPQLRTRALQRLPEAQRAKIAGLPPEQQMAKLRHYRRAKVLERAQSLLKPEQRWLVSRLPKSDRLDWSRELAEANRELMLKSLAATQRTAYETLRPFERERWLRQWVAGIAPGSKRDPRAKKRTGDSPRDRARRKKQ